MIWGCPISRNVPRIRREDEGFHPLPASRLSSTTGIWTSKIHAAGSPANWARKVLGRKRLKVGTILTLEKLEKNKLCQPTLGAHQWYGKRRHWRSRGTLAPHTGRGKKQCVYIYIYITIYNNVYIHIYVGSWNTLKLHPQRWHSRPPMNQQLAHFLVFGRIISIYYWRGSPSG